MKERPILFSAPMVRAILSGNKTQTRRVFTAKNGGVWPNKNDLPGMSQILRDCKYGQPGDQFWVREAFRLCVESDSTKPRDTDAGYRVWYEADTPHQAGFGKLRPSMFMPRWASRIQLEITAVRVERLNDISGCDATAEGVSVHADHHAKPASSIYSPVAAYRDLWESINGEGSWAVNPWVWVVEFKVLKGGAA